MDTEYEYSWLVKWEMPPYYFGSRWDGWYEVIGKHRDSNILDTLNFDLILDELEKTEKDIGNGFPSVLVWRANHFAYGWVDTIMVHESDEETLKIADEIMCALSNYPVFNDDKYEEAVESAAVKLWEEMDIEWRLEYLEGFSCFVARREFSDLPDRVKSLIYDTVER